MTDVVHEVTNVTGTDDLELLAEEIVRASWDEANGVAGFSEASLAEFLRRQDTVFVACHEIGKESRVLAGIASGRFEIKPYAGQSWLHIDEVDVCADRRRRGAGRAMMKALFDLARDQGCAFVWLGTERENEAARALYRALEPDDVADVKGFTFELGR